jgi:YHS domain-containing protein
MALLKFAIFLALATLVRWLISPSRKSPQRQTSSPASGKMIRDPHCGTHVAQELAVQVESGGETLMFCSKHCRDKYLLLRRSSEPKG